MLEIVVTGDTVQEAKAELLRLCELFGRPAPARVSIERAGAYSWTAPLRGALRSWNQ